MERAARLLLDQNRRIDGGAKIETGRQLNEPPTLVLLGRAGDIINSIPIALNFKEKTGIPVPFVVQKQFIPILECTSYCQPVPWEGELFMTINEAIAWAQKRWRKVLPIQTWGHKYNPGVQTQSFCDEHFRLAGLFGERGRIPILFDRRNAEREKRLIDRYKTTRPIILFNLNGYSSPFQHGQLIRQELSRYAGVATLIDTHTINADCIVDLLALYEMAATLLTIDTATLHLAGASKIPYVAFTVDNKPPWHTTPPLGNCRLNIPYSQTPERLPDLRSFLNSITSPTMPNILSSNGNKLIHVTDGHWLIEPRCQTAFISWMAFYKSKRMEAAVLSSIWKRDARDIGSKRFLPFLKDVLKTGLDVARDNDYLVWTNSDTILMPGFIPALRSRIVSAPIVTARRVDYATGQVHLGRDAAAFSVKWLRDNWDTVPDFLCGASELDVWMALAAREEAGIKDATATHVWKDVEPVDLPPGTLKHIDHVAPWDLPENRYHEPANIHNVNLLRAWCKLHQPNVRFTPTGFVDWSA